jgi:hypothetical protein
MIDLTAMSSRTDRVQSSTPGLHMRILAEESKEYFGINRYRNDPGVAAFEPVQHGQLQ